MNVSWFFLRTDPTVDEFEALQVLKKPEKYKTCLLDPQGERPKCWQEVFKVQPGANVQILTSSLRKVRRLNSIGGSPTLSLHPQTQKRLTEGSRPRAPTPKKTLATRDDK